jgi:diadenosine tetraphosphate (Ap4A) HIT family hydrolase
MANYDPASENNDCIFCEIVAGRMTTPGVFWEDDDFMAWLAIDPNTPGFSCVIPKKHFGSDVLHLPDDVLRSFIIAAKQVAGILEGYFDDVGRVGLVMEGTGIDHAHIKLVPMHGTEHLKRGEWKQIPSGKEFWFDTYKGWISSGGGPMADPNALRDLAENIRKRQTPISEI